MFRDKVAVIVLIAVVASASFVDAGAAMRSSIVGMADSAQSTLALGSRTEAAVFSSMSDLAKLARLTVQGFDPSSMGSAAMQRLGDALALAEGGHVLDTQRALLATLEAAPDEILKESAFWDRIDYVERLAYTNSGRGARNLNYGNLGMLRELMYSDNTLRAHIEDLIDRRAELIDNIENLAIGDKVPEGFWQARQAAVVVGNRSDTRPLVMRAMEDDALRFSNALWDELKAAPAEERHWNVVRLGNGPIGSHSSAITSEAAPQVTQLVVEKSSRVGGANFTERGGNAAIRFNQSNRGFIYRALGSFSEFLRNRAGLYSPFNIADSSWHKYGGSGQDWADSAAFAMRSSTSDLMTSTEISDLKKAEVGAPAPYVVTLSRGEETVDVYADAVDLSAGIGRDSFRGFDEKTLQTIYEQRARIDFDDPETVPMVLTAAESLYFQLLHPEIWPKLYGLDDRLRPDLPDIYVGTGDGFYTEATRRVRGTQAPEQSDLSRAQAGQGISAPAVVLGGSKIPNTAEEFLLGSGGVPGLRARYVDIYPNVVRAEQDLALERGLGPETLALDSARARKIRVFEDEGYVEVTTNDGRVIQGARVFLGTGYESDVGKLLNNFVDPDSYRGPIQLSDKLDAIDHEGNILRPDEVGIDQRGAARKVRGEEIYLTGLAAGGDLIPLSQLAGVPQNTASVANWLGRAESVALRVFAKLERPTSPMRPSDAVQQTLSFGETEGGFTAAKLSATDRRALVAEKQPRFALKYELARSLQDFRFANGESLGDDAIAIVFERASNDADGAAQFRVRTNFENDKWLEVLQRRPGLQGLLERLVRRGQPLAVVADTYPPDASRWGNRAGAVRNGTLAFLGD